MSLPPFIKVDKTYYNLSAIRSVEENVHEGKRCITVIHNRLHYTDSVVCDKNISKSLESLMTLLNNNEIPTPTYRIKPGSF